MQCDQLQIIPDCARSDHISSVLYERDLHDSYSFWVLFPVTGTKYLLEAYTASLSTSTTVCHPGL